MSGQPDKNLEEARRWLAQADDNLAWARWSAQGQYWAPACFQCHQAAEMAVKALLIRQGLRHRTHGVLKLVEQAAEYYPQAAPLAAAARRLDRYYIQTRYPDSFAAGRPGEYFERADFESAVGAAEEIRNAAAALLQT